MSQFSTEQVAIHEAQNIDRVVEFIDLEKFTPEFQKAHSDGTIHGVFYQDGHVVARDIWGEVIGNILV